MAAPLSAIDRIDKHISDGQVLLALLPPSHPLRAACLFLMALAWSRRHELSEDERDLDMSILHFTNAIFLPLPLSTIGGRRLNSIAAFYLLTKALVRRLFKFRRHSDVNNCVKYLRYLRDRSLEPIDVPYNEVLTPLVHTLCLQIQLDSGCALRNVEEMSALSRKLLASNVPELPLDSALAIEYWARNVTYAVELSNRPSKQVFECLRAARTRLPDLHAVSFALSFSLFCRFDVTKSSDDYEDAMAALDKIIASSPSEYLIRALQLAATLARARSSFFGKPEYIEEAISRFRAYLGALPLEDPQRRIAAHFLTTLERRRFVEFGVTSGPQEAHSGDPKDVDILHLATSIAKLKATTVPSKALPNHIQRMDDQDTMNRITDMADAEEAVKCYRHFLASLQTSLIPSGTMELNPILTWANLLLRAFEQTRKLDYLNEAIAVYRGMLKALHLPFPAILNFMSSLLSRFLLSNDRKDLDELMQLCSIAAADTYASAPNRFKLSCQWAMTARAYKHPFTSTAYENAISLMQDSLTFAPTLEIQHFRLVDMRDHYEKLPLDHASYQVHIGQLEQAIVTLEKGRGLLWSEMRGFRTSIEQLRAVNFPLAEKFAAVNRDLEALTKSSSSSVWMNGGESNDSKEMDPFGRLVVKQRKLLDERSGLVAQIQALPGLESFLMAPSFDTLRSAAARGPVIIINHCEWRSDIIILLRDSPPSLIPVTEDFYSRAEEMRDRLFRARKQGPDSKQVLDSKQYQKALRSVLEGLYDLVGQPVIERLRELNVQENSRIWWCPTSVFCSLPLHAMGPVRLDGRVKQYFSDLYITSYTPTLSALIEARKPSAQTSTETEPSILLVAQPDATIPNVLQEMQVVQDVSPSVTTLPWEAATPPAALEHLRDHRFAHISCHGILETGKPFDAYFKLYGGARLTLLDIVRAQLSKAEFAFLSACDTAALTEESIADEGLHLTGAVQYCGFRSVVGTMWAMADTDGPDLARSFYKSVFSDKWQGTPYYERTAGALRDSVRELRKMKGMTLERWVNFVHYGA
ncbi:CHAT domain-containing protein [Russula brevipes]|nr:CHAT domain-containing protein [Russula brevipes]